MQPKQKHKQSQNSKNNKATSKNKKNLMQPAEEEQFQNKKATMMTATKAANKNSHKTSKMKMTTTAITTWTRNSKKTIE